MKRTIWIFWAALVAASITIAQGPPTANGVKPLPGGKGAPRDPAASPASRPRPATVNQQSYSADEIKKGEQRFGAQCGFCHGRDAAGGEEGPDLTRSDIVAEDNRGDKIRPLLKTGRTDEGMPSFASLSDADAMAIVAFIHTQKTKLDADSGGRRQVDPEDLATGNAKAGLRYFDTACAKCHSATGDLAGIATRYKGLALMQRMLYPTAGRPAPKRPQVTLTLASGEKIVAPLAVEDEWTVSVTDAAGARKTYEKSAVKYEVNDPMQAHFDQLGKYTDKDMHDVYAYLESLK